MGPCRRIQLILGIMALPTARRRARAFRMCISSTETSPSNFRPAWFKSGAFRRDVACLAHFLEIGRAVPAALSPRCSPGGDIYHLGLGGIANIPEAMCQCCDRGFDSGTRSTNMRSSGRHKTRGKKNTQRRHKYPTSEARAIETMKSRGSSNRRGGDRGNGQGKRARKTETRGGEWLTWINKSYLLEFVFL